MIDRGEALLEPSWRLLERSWGPLRASWGPLGVSWSPLGCFFCFFWGPVGALLGLLGPLGALLGTLGASWRRLGASGGFLDPSWDHFGVISGIISEAFLHHFEDIVFRTVLERLWPHSGDVVAPIGPLKTAKNVERLIEFEDFRSSARDSVLMSSRSLFGGLFCYKNDPKSEPKRVRKQVGI